MGHRVRIRIRCDRRSRPAALMVLALLIALLLLSLLGVWQAAASGPRAARDRTGAQASPMLPRGYYLTKGYYNGADADGSDGNGAGVCAEGFHFASLWEILDTSNLKYNTALGTTREDSGQGPPVWRPGWVRTGYSSDASSTPGKGNCYNWSFSGAGYSGTFARLPYDWTASPGFHVWDVGSAACNEGVMRVWCVADRAGIAIYIPLIFREYQQARPMEQSGS